MVQCVVIADEITGGSSVGAMLEKNRCKVCSLINNKGIKECDTDKYDCLVYSTNSRHLSPEQSYQMVYYAARLLKSSNVKLYAKRIDPAMRGNTCAETQALLDALEDKDRMAIVVPAFPVLKRANVGGYMLVNGRSLQKAIVDIDDLGPAESGRVADLFTEKFHYKAEAIHLKDYQKGMLYLSSKIKKMAEEGVRAVIMDCISQEEINLIADAVIASEVKFIAVDPGPFTATMARKVMRSSEKQSQVHNCKIFGMIGGSSPLLAAQVETLRLEEDVLFVTVHNSLLIGDEQVRFSEISRVVDEITARFDSCQICFIVSEDVGATAQSYAEYELLLHKENRTWEEALDLVSTAYGQIAQQVLEKRGDIQAVYSAGAEFTLALCRDLKSVGLRILGQVMPLTAYGEFIDGECSGLKCITSATSAPDVHTITESIQYLKRKLEV